MSKPKEYKLGTLEEVLEVVNRDNLVNFLKDFTNYMCMRVAIAEAAKQTDVKVEQEPMFHWIDDGKNGCEVDLKITSK